MEAEDETGARHPGRRVAVDPEAPIVGIDRGLPHFADLADETGRELDRIAPPRPLRTRLRHLWPHRRP